LWVVVGLGNPGRKYSKTRHNIGFMVIEEIARRHGIDFQEEGTYRRGRGFIEGEEVLLVEPFLYMNRSGSVVKDVVNEFRIPLERLLVIHDDIDMKTGKLRIKRKGSSGGHKGVESIIQSIGSREFTRIKIGIGREEGIAPEEYVLTKFKKDEIPFIKDTIKRASDAVTSILLRGLDKAMGKFNREIVETRRDS